MNPMISFSAIVKLTCKSAIRSHVFRTLLVILFLCVILIPNTIKGDGTAMGFIQLILEYSLGFVAAVLAISAAWVACSEIATDVETGQLHLLAVKPVSRFKILAGKTAGVLVIHGVLLLLASALVYGFVMYQYGKQDFPGDEKQRVENEVLTGRRLYAPVRPDFSALAVEELNRRLENAREDEKRQLAEKTTGEERRKTLEGIEKELRASAVQAAPGGFIPWEYKGLPDDCTEPVFLRYKLFPSDSATKNENLTYGSWIFRLTFPKGDTTRDGKVEYVEGVAQIPPLEQRTIARNEYSIQEQILRYNMGAPEDVLNSIPPEVMKDINSKLIHEGKVSIGYQNYDREGKTIVFQEPDGPFLLVRETGFLRNYLRTVLVIFLGIAAVTLIAAGLAAYFTLPTAVFMTVSYGLLCICANYMLKNLQSLEGVPLDASEKLGKVLSQGVVLLLMPLGDFFVTSRLATGQLIEYSMIGNLFLYNLAFRGLPLFLLGAYLYYRRELALAMKR